MKLGIIQLSDCHIDDGNEPFLSRVKAIALAAKAIKKADAWIILFSGDMSNAGTDAQVRRGAAFLTEVQLSVAEITGTEPKLITIPGNHDCSIPSEEERTELTNNIRSGKTTEKEALLLAQAAFWNAFPAPTLPICNSKMAFLTQLEVNGETIALIGINSSWMSDLHDQQGALLFQPEWFDPIAAWAYQNEPDLVVSAIHHPIHWQKEGLQKPLWHKLARVTDVLLTGHEHEPDGFVRSAGNSSISVFEGGVLSQRDKGYEHCNFQILHIDTHRNELEHALCSWDSNAISKRNLTSSLSPAFSGLDTVIPDLSKATSTVPCALNCGCFSRYLVALSTSSAMIRAISPAGAG
jgi:predicted phosphodiesterase